MASEIPGSPWLEKEKRREGIGTGFEIGLTIGSAYNFTKGFISASSSSSKFVSGLRCARAKCIPTCGAVAGLFAVGDVVETATAYYRQKDDPFNTFASFAAVAAVATARRGPLCASFSVLGFATFGALSHYYASKYLMHKEEEKRNNNIDNTP